MHNMKRLTQFGENLYEINRITNYFDKFPMAYGTDLILYSNEVHTLQVIAENQGINQKQLTELMLRTKGATSVVLDKLMAKGLIVKEVNPADQRNFTLSLTEKGTQINNFHKEYDLDVYLRLTESTDISAEDLEITNSVLSKAIVFFKEIAKNK